MNARATSNKPVVVSMGDVCASGGYYIACAADKIVAMPGMFFVFAVLEYLCTCRILHFVAFCFAVPLAGLPALFDVFGVILVYV